MDHLRELTNTWNYLPAFRAIAENGGLQGASASLYVSPSALSRSLKQLERQLDVSLFDRVGRRLLLNSRGEQLLQTVRLAMRQIDDAVREARNAVWSGALRIWAAPHVAETLVLPAVLSLRERYPMLDVTLQSERVDVETALLAGQVDVALLGRPITSGPLECQAAGSVPYAVFGVKSRHLAKKQLRPTDLAHAAFVAPVEGGMLDDQWPVEWPRRVELRVPTLHAMLDAAKASSLLAALPLQLGTRVGLTRLRGTRYEAPLFVVRRERLQPDPVDALMTILDEQRRAEYSRAPRTPRPRT